MGARRATEAGCADGVLPMRAESKKNRRDAVLCGRESGKRESDPRHPPWQGGALPLSYSRNRVHRHRLETMRIPNDDDPL